MGGMDKKTVWLVANWKANKTIAEALDWIARVGPQIPKNETLKVVVCPAFSALSEVKKAITVGNFPLMTGAQDLSPFGTGPYTGEEPAEFLESMADLAILGHSERRKNFGETDEMVAKKVQQANTGRIIPLVCVQNAETAVPEGCKLAAYEPVWAIGTGQADTPQNANEVADKLKQQYGEELTVLYGGSVNADNVKSFTERESISGVLVGTASLDTEEFLKICKNCDH